MVSGMLVMPYLHIYMLVDSIMFVILNFRLSDFMVLMSSHKIVPMHYYTWVDIFGGHWWCQRASNEFITSEFGI